MDRLSIIIAVLAGSTLAGMVLILFLIMGFYSWPAFTISGLVGAAGAWPAGKIISRRIKRQDPNWPRRGRRGEI